uniref:Lipocln_cytosolic_FA-bd_dom domain-containing protein n=1 Tax=Panagrellus redivivus TaxID=6233 RepID=A0A7E4ZXU9_PANRE
MFLRVFVIFGLLSIGNFASFEEFDELITIRSGRSIQNSFDQEGEGSGEEPVPQVTTTTVSSVKGIPYFNPKFAKWSQYNMPGEKFYRRKQTPITDYNSEKSSRKSFLGNVLSMLGFNLDDAPVLQNPEKTIMQVLYNTTKAIAAPRQETRYSPVNRIIQNTCAPSIEASRTFRIAAFMGQWYQVMSTVQQGEYNTCRMLNYRMLNSQADDIGATFETVEYNSYPGSTGAPQMVSGFGRQNAIKGEIRFNSLLEDTLVNVLHTGPVNSAGYYQYVILGADCYYPIRVYARDPTTFKTKYQTEVFRILGKKGLINDISRALNFMKIADFSTCALPRNFFQN